MPDRPKHPEGTTHVLAWASPEIAPRCPGGAWDLYTVADFMDGTLPGEGSSFLEAAMDADRQALADWTATVLGLGCAVRLVAQDNPAGIPYGPFRPPFADPGRIARTLGRYWPQRRVPGLMYWVIPA